jgi:hypothetical protein
MIVLRCARYSKSPIDFFLDESVGDLFIWLYTCLDAIRIENIAQEEAAAKAKKSQSVPRASHRR